MIFEDVTSSRCTLQAISAFLAPTELGEEWRDGGLPEPTSPKSVMYGTSMALHGPAVRYSEYRYEQTLILTALIASAGKSLNSGTMMDVLEL